jgi:hypothetical protein
MLRAKRDSLASGVRRRRGFGSERRDQPRTRSRRSSGSPTRVTLALGREAQGWSRRRLRRGNSRFGDGPSGRVPKSRVGDPTGSREIAINETELPEWPIVWRGRPAPGEKRMPCRLHVAGPRDRRHERQSWTGARQDVSQKCPEHIKSDPRQVALTALNHPHSSQIPCK